MSDETAPAADGGCAPLAVFTDGALRHVNGVTSATTCSQLVYALAHATQQKGRFVLVATFDDDDRTEHRMTADERPLAVLKSGQLRGARVAFELRRLDPASDVVRAASPSTSPSSAASSGVGETAAGQSLPFASLTLEENVTHVHQQQNHPCNQQQQHTHSVSTGEFGMQKEPKRAPPPAYAEVIEQRCNSLTRRHRSPFSQQQHSLSQTNVTENDLASAVLGMTVDDIQARHFSAGELEALVNAQIQVITAQKSQLLGLELTLSNDFERELVQLRKQHNNLQTVLNSLRNANWPARVDAERGEAEHLHTAIDAMRTAIENKRRELRETLELQQTLERQLAFQAENADGFHQATSRGPPIYS